MFFEVKVWLSWGYSNVTQDGCRTAVIYRDSPLVRQTFNTDHIRHVTPVFAYKEDDKTERKNPLDRVVIELVAASSTEPPKLAEITVGDFYYWLAKGGVSIFSPERSALLTPKIDT
jgi:hypothetical protein